MPWFAQEYNIHVHFILFKLGYALVQPIGYRTVTLIKMRTYFVVDYMKIVKSQ